MIKKTFEELKLTGQLPSPPGVGMKILKLTQAENYSADDIGRAIMADPALTGRLLRIANSAQSGSARPITTVADATMRLGVRAVRNVALGLSLVSAYRSGQCERFEYDRFWSASLARAVAAQSLSRQMRFGAPAEAYILGLLSEIGYLALASVHPVEYSELLSTCGREPQKLARAEHARLEIDHSEVGAYLLEEWGLPEVYSRAVMMYEQRERASDDESPEALGFARILRHAHLLTEVFTAGEHTPAATWKRCADELAKLRSTLGLEPDAFHALCNGIAREWVEWGTTLNVPTQAAIDVADVPKRALAAASAAVAIEAAVAVETRTPAAARADDTNGIVNQDGAVSKGLRILAVDDDAMSLKMLERVLVKNGHHVRCAKDGNDALQIALETNPQVVIADWMMPNMDGIDLCKALRRIECGRNMFFLLLTGRGEEDRVVEAFDAGVDDYIVKPFNPKLLIARIKGGQRVIELKEKVESDKHTMMRQVAELGLLTRKLRTAALTDVLTELPNRRYIRKRLEQEWDAVVRTGKPLSVILIDIDHFKKVNDGYGHDIGDVVLKETAGMLRATTRQGEDPARLGGEEFLVICSNTNANQAAACAERLRAAVAKNTIRTGSFESQVTISLGVAERTDDMANIDVLIKAADEAVYAAKEAGRNQVFLASTAAQQRKSA